MSLRQDAEFIVTEAIKRVLPDEAVRLELCKVSQIGEDLLLEYKVGKERACLQES